MVPSACSAAGLPLILGQCEVGAMKISISKSEKRMECSLWTGDDLLPQMEEYLGVLLTSEGRAGTPGQTRDTLET